MATITSNDQINLRSGPGTQYAVLGQLAPGVTCEALGRSEDEQWWLVRLSPSQTAAGRGWVSAGWVSAVDTGAVPTVNAEGQVLALAETPAGPGPEALVLQRSPALDEIVSIGADFDAVWTLQNDTGETWRPADTSLRFVSAIGDARIHKFGMRSQLTREVPPGDQYEAAVDMKLPDFPGIFGETWAIVQNGRTLCQFELRISAR